MPYLREIVTAGHPVLAKIAKRVAPREIADPLFQQLIDDMFATMYDAPGVGLAAPQVGISKRLFVIDVRDDEHPAAAVINPKFEPVEGEPVEELVLNEGCLSVPGKVGEISRRTRVAVSGLDRNGDKIRLEGDGLFAQCLQHEIDHLDGLLYLHRATNVRDVTPDDEEEDADDAGAA